MLIFGDFGVDVIKIEVGQKGKVGDMMCYVGVLLIGDFGLIYISFNCNKKLVQLDVKIEDGKVVIVVLFKDVDVFFYNVCLVGMGCFGFDYDSVKKINFGIVYVYCVGFGVGGLYEKCQVYDDLIQGVLGFVVLNVMCFGGDLEYVLSLVVDKMVGLFVIYVILVVLYYK